MSKHKLQITSLGVFIFWGIFSPLISQAVCPICAVTIAGGIGLSRWLKVDDLISGVWLGGLTLTFVFWSLAWLKKKNINFPLKEIIISFAFYSFIILSLYFGKFIGAPYNKLWGVDKLLLGIFLGSSAFGLGVATNYFLRKKNNGQGHFPFQKVIIPILFLLVTSLIFYFIYGS